VEVDLAGYRIDSVIGHGGMATVYRAEQRSLGREVALKVLAPELAHDGAFRERFLSESRVAARLEHPCVVPIYDAGESEGVLYIAMRLVPGRDLRALLRSEGRLPLEAALAVLEQLAAGLDAAHALGLVHRDVKPGNALVESREDGGPLRVFLSDFGLARPATGGRGHDSGSSLGSLHYMPPERMLGEPEDARSDIYSLGCLLYECLTGEVPFARESGEAISYAHRQATLPRAAEHADGIPPALDDVIAWALAKSPDARPAGAVQFAEAAVAAAGATGAMGRPRAAEPASRPAAARPLRDTVGRLDEEALLLAALRRATHGRGEVVLLSGEAGIGKTALAQRVCEEAERLGVPTVWGTGGNFGEAPPAYWHWAQVVRSLLGRNDGALLLEGLGPSASWLAAVAPELGGELAGDDAPAAANDGRFHIYDTLRLLLLRSAAGAGLVVVLDDLHLADDASLQALTFVSSAIRDSGVLVVGTYREGELRSATGGGERGSGSLLAALLGSSTSVSLSALDGAQVRRLISARAGSDTTGTLVDRIQEVTGGNPLFVCEILNLLESQGRLDDHLDHGALPLPTGVNEVISQRLATLPQPAREALETGAVIGTRFRSGTLARATAMPPEELLEPLEHAVRAGLLHAPVADTYAFSHGLVQMVLYEGLPRRRRCEIHGAVGDALEHVYDARAGEGLAEIAYHLLEAAPAQGGERAVEYARRAADRAVRTFAYDEAVTLYARALELVDPADASERIALLQALGESQMRVGDTEAARSSLGRAAEAARAVGDADALGRAALASNIWGLTFGIDEGLVRLAEEAVQALERAGDPGLLACVKGVLASALYWAREAERREQLVEEALELARDEHARLASADSGRVLGYVLGRYLLARWGPRSATDDYELSDELVALSHELQDLELEILARNWRVIELLEMGRFREVDQEIARLQQIATELRQPRAMLFVPLHQASRAGTLGKLAEAERLNAESYEIGLRVRGTIGELAGTAQMLSIRMQQGRLAELEAPLRALCDGHPTMVATQCVLALALVQDGRLGEGRAEFERLMALGRDGFPQDNCHIISVAMIGEVAAALDDAERAAELYSWLEPYAGRWVVSPNAAALWPVSRSLARLATVARSFDAAWTHLAEARKQALAAGARPSIALAALDQARLLLASDPMADAERVRALAREARELAQELDMGFVVDGATLLEAAAAGDPDGDSE
jgi:hypothetical protein